MVTKRQKAVKSYPLTDIGHSTDRISYSHCISTNNNNNNTKWTVNICKPFSLTHKNSWPIRIRLSLTLLSNIDTSLVNSSAATSWLSAVKTGQVNLRGIAALGQNWCTCMSNSHTRHVPIDLPLLETAPSVTWAKQVVYKGESRLWI